MMKINVNQLSVETMMNKLKHCSSQPERTLNTVKLLLKAWVPRER